MPLSRSPLCMLTLHVWLQALMFAMHRSAQDPSTPSSPIVHLLSAGASITATNRSGLSALMIACTSPADILWKMILRFTSAAAVREALTRADVHGNAALHLAARAGCAAVCESLIAHGAAILACGVLDAGVQWRVGCSMPPCSDGCSAGSGT